ncbi:hypothetical protein Ddc_06758 [Ditylenchus destructor]|nr:hypothetical protein Ddc_06758 [Ditylenchus destructor]
MTNVLSDDFPKSMHLNYFPHIRALAIEQNIGTQLKCVTLQRTCKWAAAVMAEPGPVGLFTALLLGTSRLRSCGRIVLTTLCSPLKIPIMNERMGRCSDGPPDRISSEESPMPAVR